MTRNKWLLLFLWAAVILTALWVGGTLYQMLVIVPLWTASPPESLRSFLETGYLRTVLHFFGPPFVFARTLALVLALIAGWPSRPHRNALMVALACWLFVVALTLLYIYPMNDSLFVVGASQPGDAAALELLHRWIFADRIRFLIGCIGFTALLWAFRLPAPDRTPQLTRGE